MVCGSCQEVRLPCFWRGARMFEIVKRRHIRPADDLVPRTSPGPQPGAPDMLWQAKHVVGRKADGRSFLRSLSGF